MELNNRRNRYIAILASVSVVILAVGWQIRPLRTSQAPLSQADLTRLARLSQRNNLEGMAGFFAEVARGANAGLVWVEGLQESGLVWDASGEVMVPLRVPNPQQPAWLLASDESQLPLQAELYSEPLSFMLLKSPPELALVPLQQGSGRAIRQASWLVRVWKTAPQSYEFEPGLFSGLGKLTCDGLEVQEILSSFSGDTRALGSGVFDLEGRLIGVTLLCDSRPRTILAESLARAVDRGRAVDSQIQFRYGFLPVELSDKTKAYFGADHGLWVREVWRDTLAWDLGVRPGDVITALDAEETRKLEDLAMMTVPMYRPQYTLTIRRGSISRNVVFPPGAGLTDEPPSNTRNALVFGQAPAGIEIRRVNPGTVADRAGLRVGDRVVSTGPRFGAGKVDPDQIKGSQQAPLFVVAERGDRLLGLFLE